MECPNRPNDDDYRVSEIDSDSGDFNDDDVLDEDYKPVHDESVSMYWFCHRCHRDGVSILTVYG